MNTNSEMINKCLNIESMVRWMILKGITDTRELVNAVDEKYEPKNEWEMEMYSEAIIYAKLGVLN